MIVIEAPRDGFIAQIFVQHGAVVAKDHLLLHFDDVGERIDVVRLQLLKLVAENAEIASSDERNKVFNHSVQSMLEASQALFRARDVRREATREEVVVGKKTSMDEWFADQRLIRARTAARRTKLNTGFSEALQQHGKDMLKIALGAIETEHQALQLRLLKNRVVSPMQGVVQFHCMVNGFYRRGDLIAEVHPA